MRKAASIILLCVAMGLMKAFRAGWALGTHRISRLLQGLGDRVRAVPVLR